MTEPVFVSVEAHLDALGRALIPFRREAERLARLGADLACVLGRGGRLLAAGNGGSAAEAQHLTSELVGRFLHDRRSFSAISLCAESSSVSAIVNDYGAEEMFARQVEGHGRPGDVLVLLSTSGTSPNVLRAAERGRALRLTVWASRARPPTPSPRCATTRSASTPPPPRRSRRATSWPSMRCAPRSTVTSACR